MLHILKKTAKKSMIWIKTTIFAISKNQYTKTDYEKTINSIHDAGRTMAVSTDFSVTA